MVIELKELLRVERALVTRQSTRAEIQACLDIYGMAEQNLPKAVALAWQEKNRLFDNLPEGEKQKMQFHDEEHTNTVTTLVARALVGAKKINLKLDQSQVQQLLVAAITHDLGYIKEKNDTLSVDFSNDQGGHEERSKIKVDDILHQVISDSELTEIKNYIDWTKLSKNLQGKMIQQEKGLILRFADLCAGIAIDETRYEEKMVGLWQELQQAEYNPYESLEHLKASQTKKGTIFIDNMAVSMEPFLQLLDAEAEGKNNIRLAIAKNRAYAAAVREKLPENL